MSFIVICSELPVRTQWELALQHLSYGGNPALPEIRLAKTVRNTSGYPLPEAFIGVPVSLRLLRFCISEFHFFSLSVSSSDNEYMPMPTKKSKVEFLMGHSENYMFLLNSRYCVRIFLTKSVQTIPGRWACQKGVTALRCLLGVM